MTDAPELTTVGPTFAVAHAGTEVRRVDGLSPGTDHELDGLSFRTLPQPGELLATFATVNDVHFGETVCGLIDGSDVGPVFTVGPGDDPYPEVMNRGAVAEMAAVDPAAVLVKGDLTSEGTQAEYDAFLQCYGPVFGERLVHVRGNHESYHDAPFAAWPTQVVDVPGARLALLDTSVSRRAGGDLTTEQLEWLDALAAEADRPVLVFGHHQCYDVDSTGDEPDDYFGIRPAASRALVEVVARRPAILGYFAGHTHRARVRRFTATGDVPFTEVPCVKDYPGAWAEYRVHDGGVLQIVHRISTPEALAWTEQTRHMYFDTYGPYALGLLEHRCFAIGRRPGTP